MKLVLLYTKGDCLSKRWSMSKYLGDEFDKYVNQWEKAQADGVFDDAPSPPAPPAQEPDFFGNYRPNKDVTDIKDVDSDYWNHVYKLSRHSGDSPDPLDELQPMNEVRDDRTTKFTLVKTTKPDGKSSGKITDELGGLSNPNNRSNRGEDQRSRVTPNWAGGDDIQELQAMKMNLEKLESKINASEGLGDMKKMKSLMNKMESLRKQIDELSDGIPPEFKTEYLS